MRRKLFLVEMRNKADSRDDEVWKIRASSKATAKIAATLIANISAGRFYADRVVPVRGGTRADKMLARDFRTYCTKTFP